MAEWRPVRRPTAPILIALFIGVLALAGCADITVCRVHALDPMVTAHKPQLFQELQTTDLTDPLYLSENCFSHGLEAEKKNPSEALAYFSDSAAHSYHILATITDSNTRTVVQAQQLYNAAISHCLRLAKRTGRLNSSGESNMLTSRGGRVSAMRIGFARPIADFGAMEPCAEYRVDGLEHQFQTEGLGVPVLVRRPDEARRPGHDYVPKGDIFAATVLLRFDSNSMAATRFELVNPLTTSEVELQGRTVPLATDLTTPLACFTAEKNVFQLDYLPFLRANRLNDRKGMCMLEPYEPGKIPVILVHGLLSSPITWVPLLNELRGDPMLRNRFQFWAYYYPTGHPFFGTAAEFRADLGRLRADLDPQHRDAAFEHMVLIGHSMGGLISKLMTQEGGTDLWRIISAKPLDELDLSQALREKLQQTFFFERQRQITRVIFLGTPHHGSTMSLSPAGWLAAHLVKFRPDLDSFSREMVERIPDLSFRQIPTSVELLAPDSPALQALAARPPPSGVHYHSVIGVRQAVRRLAGDAEPGDGVVAYHSAHLEGVESELVVPANHFTVHQNGETVKEIRRILLEHLAD